MTNNNDGIKIVETSNKSEISSMKACDYIKAKIEYIGDDKNKESFINEKEHSSADDAIKVILDFIENGKKLSEKDIKNNFKIASMINEKKAKFNEAIIKDQIKSVNVTVNNDFKDIFVKWPKDKTEILNILYTLGMDSLYVSENTMVAISNKDISDIDIVARFPEDFGILLNAKDNNVDINYILKSIKVDISNIEYERESFRNKIKNGSNVNTISTSNPNVSIDKDYWNPDKICVINKLITLEPNNNWYIASSTYGESLVLVSANERRKIQWKIDLPVKWGVPNNFNSESIIDAKAMCLALEQVTKHIAAAGAGRSRR